MLVTRAGLHEGETVFVWGIGGGVATAALQIGKALGARVIVTSSSDEKLAHARELGADATVNHASEDVKARVKELTDGRGADVVVEHVGEATWRTSLDVAAQGGRIVVCGATTGPNPPAGLHRIWWKQLSILGSTMGTKADFEGAYELVAEGRAQPVVDSVFPLAEARAAHERLEAGEQLGKVVLCDPGLAAQDDSRSGEPGLTASRATVAPRAASGAGRASPAAATRTSRAALDGSRNAFARPSRKGSAAR